MILPDAEKSIPNATAACDVELEAVEEDNLERHCDSTRCSKNDAEK